MTADAESGLRDRALEVPGRSGRRLFLGTPEFVPRREQQRREPFGGPISGTSTAISLGYRGKLVCPSQRQGTLLLLDRVLEEELEVGSAYPPGLAGRDGRDTAVFRQAKRGAGGKTVAKRAAEGRILAAGRKEMRCSP